MRTYFDNQTVALAALVERAITRPFNTVRIESVSGTVHVRFNNGAWLPCRSGRVWETSPGEAWDKMEFLSTAGGTVEVTYGLGSFGGGAGGGGVAVYYGTGIPSVDPDDTNAPAIYYTNDGSGAVWVWTSGGWQQILG